MLLYVHVPFCRSKCRYCSFYSGAMDQDGLDLYLDGLIKEIYLHQDRVGRVRLDSIFFGGGTPSLLPANYLQMIMSTLDQAFDVSKGLEFTLEGNPDSLGDPRYLRDLYELGVNRLSMGVQSLNDESLKFLGRTHTAKQAVVAYSTARNLGFSNINLDLIWGLPGQRINTYMQELKTIVTLKADHLSCYGLTVEASTPLERDCLAGRVELPDEEEQGRMFVYGAEYLESQGYFHYEVSNFARMGFRCRHNTGYWDGEDYIGLGPAAVSTLDGKRWDNPPDLAQWHRACSEGSIGREVEELGPRERVRERIMLGLRTSLGLRLREYRELTGRVFIKDHEPLVAALRQKDLIRIRDGYMRLTTQGMLVCNTIVENLFASLDRIEKAQAAE